MIIALISAGVGGAFARVMAGSFDGFGWENPSQHRRSRRLGYGHRNTFGSVSTCMLACSDAYYCYCTTYRNIQRRTFGIHLD